MQAPYTLATDVLGAGHIACCQACSADLVPYSALQKLSAPDCPQQQWCGLTKWFMCKLLIANRAAHAGMGQATSWLLGLLPFGTCVTVPTQQRNCMPLYTVLSKTKNKTRSERLKLLFFFFMEVEVLENICWIWCSTFLASRHLGFPKSPAGSVERVMHTQVILVHGIIYPIDVSSCMLLVSPGSHSLQETGCRGLMNSPKSTQPFQSSACTSQRSRRPLGSNLLLAFQNVTCFPSIL